MYLPKVRQIVGGKIPGILKDPATGLKFNGKFVRDFLGNFFKGDKITSESKPLELVPFTEEQAERSNSDFYSDFVTPNEAQYEKGAFPRYFVKDGRTGKIIEVDQDKYNTQKKENKLYRRVLRIEWYITGNPEDQIINGYLYPGTKAKNQDVINQAEKILPGIGEQILKDPGQFVRK